MSAPRRARTRTVSNDKDNRVPMTLWNSGEVLDELRKNSVEYANLADSISQSLRKLEHELRNLPIRIATAVEDDDAELSFARGGSSWILSIRTKPFDDEDCGTPVNDAPLGHKILAANLVQELLITMATLQTDTLEKLRMCSPSLSDFTELPEPPTTASEYGPPDDFDVPGGHGDEIPF